MLGRLLSIWLHAEPGVPDRAGDDYALKRRGGQLEGSDHGAYRVPKRDLLTRLQVLIEQKRLEVATKSRAAWSLITELAEMKSSTMSATDDDLVMAFALARWWVRKMAPRRCWGVAA